MKKIIMGLATIAAVGALTFTATSAYFSDNSSVAADTFTAGTMNIDATKGGVYNADGVNIGHLAPGEITGTKTFTVKNTGSIDAATFSRFTLEGDEEMASALKIYDYKVDFFKANGQPATRWTTHDNYWGTTINQDYFIKNGDVSKWTAKGGTNILNSWVTGNGPLDLVPNEGVKSWDVEGLPAGAYYTVSVRFQMDPQATSAVMGKSVNVGFKAMATQINTDAIAALGFSQAADWKSAAAGALASY